jgi:hypothetical protein
MAAGMNCCSSDATLERPGAQRSVDNRKEHRTAASQRNQLKVFYSSVLDFSDGIILPIHRGIEVGIKY